MDVPYILSIVTYLPALTALLLLFIPRGSDRAVKCVAFVGSLITFVLSLHLFKHFDPVRGDMQFEISNTWIQTATYSIRHHLGIDGISLFLVILTTFLTPLAILSSWKSIEKRIKPFMICLLTLETGMIGVFCALDLVLFYVFWEVMLIPMYFLIGIWGGERKIYAAVKFILYTMVGSLLMLVGILYLYANAGTFDLIEITRRLSEGSLHFSPGAESWLFLAFLIAFVIKVPLFPFHTWLPDAHVEAPTAGSVILAGVLLKMGTYGLLRFCLPLFPAAAYSMAPVLSVLAIIGIIYGALVAMVQPDLKKLVAYSSVSHMGLVVLGIFAFTTQGLQGSTLQMLNHGLSTGALFLLVGMMYERRHTRMISEFGGLAHVSPVLAAAFLIVSLSSIGLPGLNGFVGEVLVLAGTFFRNKAYAAFAATGMILGAVYMLWMYQRVFLGKITNAANAEIKDIGLREKLILLPLILVMLWIGVYSEPFLRRMGPSLLLVQQRIERTRTPEGDYKVNRLPAPAIDGEQAK